MKKMFGPIILAFWFLYCHTVGRIVSEVQYILAKRATAKLKRRLY